MQLACFAFTYQCSAKGLGEQEYRVGALCPLFIFPNQLLESAKIPLSQDYLLCST